jgi:SNF2 family DNA or RNA helicase
MTTQTMMTRDAQYLIVPYHGGLATLIPHAREMDYQGQRYLILPNGRDETRLARNLGFEVPAPILTKYDWCNTKPWEIQKTTAAMLVENERAYVLSTMGTGKTRAVLYAADWLMRTGQVKRMLVVAPLSTLTLVWEAEVFRMLMRRRVKILHGLREKRLENLRTGAEICVINHHGVGVIQHELVSARFDLVVIDELATFRNKSTELWKALTTVVAPAKYAWGLTGSPTPNEPTDAWAQVKLLTPARTTRTFGAFRDQVMTRISQFRWVARKEANQIVHEAMQPSVRFTLDDVLELPPTSYVDREVVLDAQAQKAYDLLIRKLRMMTDNGKAITAVNEGVLQTKLLQVACGYIYTDDKTVYSLPSAARLRALDETIAETDRKVIVFVPYIHALEGVAEHLRKHKHDVAVVHGGTPKAQRDMIFTNFQAAAAPRIVVAHPGCMAHGLTLTAANTTIWYAPTSNLETYEQANARTVRPGQTSKTVIAHLFGTKIEKHVYYRLRQKARMQGLLLELFKTT